MSNTDLIKQLRTLTQAGMKDCKDALQEAAGDLQKAVDIIKIKGQNIADGRSGRVASEGRIELQEFSGFSAAMEINSNTDFVANSSEFKAFCQVALHQLAISFAAGEEFSTDTVEEERQSLVAQTKENVVVRRWWIGEALHPDVRVFSYLHSNNQIGVLLTLQGPIGNSDFVALGENLAMQVAAMNPLAVSVDRLSPSEVERQKTIFETQLKELNKPQASWPKIMEGKMRKWHSEVCLLEQESVIIPKTTVAQTIKDVEKKSGTTITVVNFIRCQVGEGIEKDPINLVEDVNKLIQG